MERSENAHGSVHLGLLTARHVAESHPPSVSSFLPASAFARPRAKRLLCYVQPDVILDSGVQQVDSRASARRSEKVSERARGRERERERSQTGMDNKTLDLGPNDDNLSHTTGFGKGIRRH